MARDSYEGPAFRQCHPDHTDFDETVRASSRHPYRFNPAGEFGVVYVALAAETARAELERQANRAGVPVEQLAPRVMLELSVKLQQILDLTDPDVRKDWDIAIDDVEGDDYTRCQEVARVARREGYEAILYPSATGVGENLAIFYDQRRTGSWVTIAASQEVRFDHSRWWRRKLRIRIFGKDE